MEPIALNTLIEWSNGTQQRVVRIDENNSGVYLMDINSKYGFPERKAMTELLEALDSGLAKRMTEDPHATFIQEDKIPDRHREIRDKAWEIVSYLIDAQRVGRLLHSKKTRGPLILETARRFRTDRKTVEKYIRRFWQRGMTPNALLPDYSNCGIKPENWDPAKCKKLGRPRKFGEVLGEVGMNVDEETRRNMRCALARFYWSNPQATLRSTYTEMLETYYVKEYRYDDDGNKSPIIKDENSIPSFDQFRYFYETTRMVVHEDNMRMGRTKRKRTRRAVTHSSTEPGMAPGSVFQIDATVADCYLVSQFNRSWIIGRPVIYVVQDVFSRLIVGLYVGLEGPSWLGAMMALINTVRNKVEFCAEYGITIAEEEWNAHHLPARILGDRGEMLSDKVIPLIRALNVEIANTEPYRPDQKGIVEQYFRIFHGKVKPFAPGYIDKDFRERGGHDYRKDATWTLHEFTEVMIRCVRHYNNNRLENYKLAPDMLADNVVPIPTKLWEWGLRNRPRAVRTMPEEIVKLNLLPRRVGSATRYGIRFEKDLFYTCGVAVTENWFEKAMRFGSWEVEIAYDPRDMTRVYLPSEDGRSFEVCELTSASDRYRGMSLDEIQYVWNFEALQKEEYRHSKLQSEVETQARIKEIAKRSSLEAQMTSSEESDRQKIKGIKKKRAIEKEVQRKKEATRLDGKGSTVPTALEVEDPIDESLPELSDHGTEIEEDDLDYLARLREDMQRERSR